jgi:DNA (cytosine-5)-methyltransferase 1
MNYLSLCSGIEAATMAWHPLGWRPWAFSEIDAFPSAVLAHHYPTVPNLGDMTRFQEWPDAAIDVLVGGTPCQSFSVAGLRKGLDDPRGNLMLTYGAIARRYRPKWVVWENVPGVLSSNGGRDFGTFLGLLGELGYGFAYRVLDAQYTGLAQRRKRVFVVGCLGDWRRAAAVLFERASLRGDPAPSRGKGEGAARRVVGSLAESSGHARPGDNVQSTDYLIPATANTLTARMHKGINSTVDEGQTPIPVYVQPLADPLCANEQRTYTHEGENNFRTRNVQDYGGDAGEIAPTLRSMGHDGSHANGGGQVAVAFEARFARNGRGAPSDVVPPLKAESGTTGKGDGAPLVAFDTTQLTNPNNRSNPQPGDPCHPLSAQAHPPAIAFQSNANANDGIGEDIAPTLRTGSGGTSGNGPAVAFDWQMGAKAGGVGAAEEQAGTLGTTRSPAVAGGGVGMQVRRLTARECERLQGFPDDYTLIPYHGKLAKDGPRYKALGNSMAVPVMAWIGRRIAAVDLISDRGN